MGDIVRIPDPYHYRFPWIADEAEFREFNLAQIEEIIQLEDPATIAAVMVEPVTGSNGLIIPPAGWLGGLRALRPLRHPPHLRRGDVGVRPDRPLVRVDHEGVSPDIMTIAKGITSGYVPLGACMVSADVATAVDGIPSAPA